MEDGDREGPCEMETLLRILLDELFLFANLLLRQMTTRGTGDWIFGIYIILILHAIDD